MTQQLAVAVPGKSAIFLQWRLTAIRSYITRRCTPGGNTRLTRAGKSGSRIERVTMVGRRITAIAIEIATGGDVHAARFNGWYDGVHGKEEIECATVQILYRSRERLCGGVVIPVDASRQCFVKIEVCPVGVYERLRRIVAQRHLVVERRTKKSGQKVRQCKQ